MQADARAANKNGPVPVHWPLRLDCPAGKTLRLFPPKAGSRRPQWPTSSNPKSRKKIARLAHLTPTPSEEGGRNLFHLLGIGCPGSRMSCTSKLGHVFLVNRTLLPVLLPASTRGPGVTPFLLPIPFPTLGKDQGGKRMVKNSSTETELQGAIQKLRI